MHLDLCILQFQFYSLFAQLLTIRKEYDEADHCYEKACELAIPLFGGKESDYLSSKSSFTVVQESHRRLRVNLMLDRKEVAIGIYNTVKNILINSMSLNAAMIEQAFYNYAKLWYEFGFFDFAKKAYEYALQCGVEKYTNTLREKIKGCESRITDSKITIGGIE